jgi:hypothetical protein
MVRLSMGGNLKNSGRERNKQKNKISIVNGTQDNLSGPFRKGRSEYVRLWPFKLAGWNFSNCPNGHGVEVGMSSLQNNPFFRMQADFPRCGGQGQW